MPSRCVRCVFRNGCWGKKVEWKLTSADLFVDRLETLQFGEWVGILFIRYLQSIGVALSTIQAHNVSTITFC